MSLVIKARQILIGPAGQRITDGAVLVDHGTITAVLALPWRSTWVESM